MKKLSFIILIGFLVFGCKQEKKNTVMAQQEETADQLSASVRHHEWVSLEREDGSVLKAFLVFPERKDNADAVIVIHENRGLNDWARSFADSLAAQGFLVIAPDLISNTVEGVERTTDFENSDKAREALYNLDPDGVTRDLDRVFQHVRGLPSSTGTVSVMGFCWGGSQTFRYATNNKELERALVFYGTAPEDKSVLQTIQCPVYGFYGGDDNRVNATIPETKEAMEKYGKVYETVIYEGAGHAFMRRGAEETSGPNKEAHVAAWKSLLEKLQ